MGVSFSQAQYRAMYSLTQLDEMVDLLGPGSDDEGMVKYTKCQTGALASPDG